MSTLWENAQNAINEGETRQAHVYLAKLLKQEPNNSNAWYLLSTIVPTVAQQKIFLNKALKIDPDHAKSLADLAGLERKVPEPELVLPISAEADDLDAQAAGTTVPSWMADSTAVPQEIVEKKVVKMADTIVEVPALPEEPIPDWLKAEPADEWIDTPDENATIVAPPPKPPVTKTITAPKPVAKPVPVANSSNNSPVLTVLIIVAILVAFFLVWTVLQYFGVI
jgi:hypothetical protein